jgi:hypothetical protein
MVVNYHQQVLLFIFPKGGQGIKSQHEYEQDYILALVNQ